MLLYGYITNINITTLCIKIRSLELDN